MLLAPLYIGAAAQTLAERHVPYKELAIYCGLQFGSKALAEAQKLVYIGVKQHAFAEIAETTFRHLLGLSLDWHLRKKMGEVIRVMGRGISIPRPLGYSPPPCFPCSLRSHASC